MPDTIVPALRRYGRSLLLWTGGLVLFSLLSGLYAAFTSPIGIRGWAAIPLQLAHIPAWIGVYLPATAFAGGIALGNADVHAAPERGARRGRVGAALVAALVAALLTAGVVLLLLGYVAPHVEAAYWRSVPAPDGAGGPAVAETRDWLRAEYARAAAAARARPEFSHIGRSGPWSQANLVGYQYHVQNASALLTVTLALLGCIIGAWTRAPRFAFWSSLAHRWAGATLLIGWAWLALLVGHELTTQRLVPPVLAAYLVTLVPVTVLVALTWAWQLSRVRRGAGPAGAALDDD